MTASIRIDPERILDAEAEIRIAMHHASVDLHNIALSVDPHLVNRVAVGQAHFVAARQAIL